MEVKTFEIHEDVEVTHEGTTFRCWAWAGDHGTMEAEDLEDLEEYELRDLIMGKGSTMSYAQRDFYAKLHDYRRHNKS